LYDDADKAGLSTSERRLAEVRRGDIALRNNDAVSAIKLYRAAIAKRKDAEVLAKLGDASEKAGLVKEAIDAYREALSLSPDYKPAKDGLERVKKP
jgi:predicted TPR repeat methyltransferase